MNIIKLTKSEIIMILMIFICAFFIAISIPRFSKFVHQVQDQGLKSIATTMWEGEGGMINPAPANELFTNEQFLVEDVIYLLEKAGLKPRIHCLALTGSAYIKFKFIKLGSLRISNHAGKPKYNYRWNLRSDITKFIRLQNYGPTRFFYPISMAQEMVDHIINYHRVIYGNTNDK